VAVARHVGAGSDRKQQSETANDQEAAAQQAEELDPGMLRNASSRTVATSPSMSMPPANVAAPIRWRARTSVSPAPAITTVT
jgi:hypothetical protein